MHSQHGWEYLKRLGYSKPVPRPRHAKADPQVQEVLKNLPQRVNEVQQAFPDATVELWATDQHRVGLKPILRRVWVRKGSRPYITI
jgi:hypothetical protein